MAKKRKSKRAASDEIKSLTTELDTLRKERNIAVFKHDVLALQSEGMKNAIESIKRILAKLKKPNPPPV